MGLAVPYAAGGEQDPVAKEVKPVLCRVVCAIPTLSELMSYRMGPKKTHSVSASLCLGSACVLGMGGHSPGCVCTLSRGGFLAV